MKRPDELALLRDGQSHDRAVLAEVETCPFRSVVTTFGAKPGDFKAKPGARCVLENGHDGPHSFAETPAGHIRNALLLLGGIDALAHGGLSTARDYEQLFEAIDAITKRLARALAALEGRMTPVHLERGSSKNAALYHRTACGVALLKSTRRAQQDWVDRVTRDLDAVTCRSCRATSYYEQRSGVAALAHTGEV